MPGDRFRLVRMAKPTRSGVLAKVVFLLAQPLDAADTLGWLPVPVGQDNMAAARAPARQRR